MKTWKRITLTSALLIGSTATFASWSFKEFDNALTTLTTLGTPQIATVFKARPSTLRLGAAPPAVTAPETTKVSLEQEKKSSSASVFAIDPLGKAGKVYVGCTYLITWQAPGKILKLESELINAGTQRAASSSVSGLANAYTLSPAKQQISWKVGGVWPGIYYISVDKINGTSLIERSSTFIIDTIPLALGSAEKKSLCESSGGTP